MDNGYHWINGEEMGADNERLDVRSPFDQSLVGTVPRGGALEVNLAIAAARLAFDSWRWVPGLEKGALLHAIAAQIRAEGTEIATLLTREGGKPFCENRDEVEWTAGCFDYYAEVGRSSRGLSLPPVFEHQVNWTVKEPYGVVVCLTPWNYPLLLLSWKVAPALAAGNTVIIKPSLETPLSTLALKGAFSVLPRGVVSIITGHGPEVGQALVESPDTDLIALTGSVETGRHLAGICARSLKPTHLELGGKDPFIVCEDADLDVAAQAAVWAGCLNSGQVCTSAERFYIFDSVFEEFVTKATELAKALRLGDPLDPTTDLGPMISKKQMEKVDAQVQAALAQGACLHCGGRRSPRFETGYFYEPTVLTHLQPTMELLTEETFGPVLPLVPVAGIDEAIARANDSKYALGATIMTRNLEWAMKAMERVRAGTFWINDPLTDNDAGPFGGSRCTGNSRELGEEGLDAFRHTKHVHLDYKMESKPYWYPYWKYNQAPRPEDGAEGSL